MRRRGEIFCDLLAFLGVFLLLQQFSLQTERTVVFSEKLPNNFDGFRVVQLSDLHGRQFGWENHRLLQAVQKLRPDLIAVTGDLLDEPGELSQTMELLKSFTALCPTVFVTGNHEWSLPDIWEALRAIRACGVTILENEGVFLRRGDQEILLGGVHDPCGFRDQPNPLFVGQTLRQAVGPETFFLLLAHRNETADYWAGTAADLVLAGHAHGGLIRLPFFGGLISPHSPRGHDSGLYRSGGTQLYVSRGLGGKGLRLFNRPEVSLLILKKS